MKPTKIIIPPNIILATPGAYLVGGSIRDLLLGNTPIDYDVVVSENPEKYARQLAIHLAGRLVKIGKAGQTILRVVSKDNIVDVSALNGQTIAEDLQKRDFTINAMAYELSSDTLIDIAGGQRDLGQKIIRMQSPRAFISDPVRLLRAYRLAACLNLVIESKTLSAIQRHADLIRRCAGERIRDELFKILRAPESHPALSLMKDSGILFHIFPELSDTHEDIENTAEARPVLKQSLAAYRHLESLLNDPYQFLPRSLEPFYQGLDDTTNALLKFSMLWHDIGRSGFQTQNENGRQRFGGHATQSAEMAKGICQRFRFSNRHTAYINLIIRYHRQPFALFYANRNNRLAVKDMLRFFMNCRDQTPALMVHAIAELYGNKEINAAENQSFLDFTIHLIRHEYARFKAKAATAPLITGRDLIREFGLTPSPLFRRLLSLIEEERLARAKMTREDALRLVKKYIAELEWSSL